MARRTCPECGSPDLDDTRPGEVVCRACGAVAFAPEQCPTCGHLNPPGEQRCASCGQALTAFGQVIARHDGAGAGPWLGHVRSQAAGLKAQAEVESQRRLEALREVDRRREQAEAELVAEQHRRDRQTLQVALLAVLAIIVLVILAAVVYALR